ncbi:hypothetical protein [Nitrospira sp. Nam80]
MQPGLAIDGYGRELALFQSVTLTLQPGPAPQYVYLFYCERPYGACGSAPAPRIKDSAEVDVSSEKWPVPNLQVSLTHATAAGQASRLPLWPVLLGVIEWNKEGKLGVTRSQSPFTRVPGSHIAAPSGKTVMRVGQENLADPYHFRISSQVANGMLQNRFAIDRDGNPIFWGNVTITGSTRAAVIPIPSGGTPIKAELKSSIGADVRWRAALEPKKGGKQVLKVSFRSKAGPGEKVVEDTLDLDIGVKARRLSNLLGQFNENSKLVNVKKIGTMPLALLEHHRPKDDAAEPDDLNRGPVFDDRESSLEYVGGTLRFTPEGAEPTGRFCGCDREPERTKKLPEGVILKPGTAVPVPSPRDIYCIRVKPGDQAPIEEVRIAGGPFKEEDYNRRVTIGHSPSHFEPWLTMLGNGTVALPGGKITDTGKAFPMINVIGTLRLPAVKPDPRDQLFNNLMVFAFTRGVLSVSSSLIKITFNLPDSIGPDPNWSYDLSLRNLSRTELKLINGIERMVRGNAPQSPTIIQNLPQRIGPSGTETIQIAHNGIPIGTGNLSIEVTVVMRADSLTVAAKEMSKEIVVNEIG